jgi:plastocyanin
LVLIRAVASAVVAVVLLIVSARGDTAAATGVVSARGRDASAPGDVASAAGSAATQAAAATGIRGRLDIRRLARPAERRPEVASPGATGPRDLSDLRHGVVYLETAPRAAFDEREPGRAVLDQRNERFVPHVLAVMVGTIVDFPNNDRTYHNVFSLSRARKFDLGRYAAGRSKSVRMDRTGVIRVFCDIHSHMNAFVLVFNHPFFDVTDTEGRFTMPSVPPGAYTVVGWYEGEPRITRPVIVPANGWAEVELVVP